MDVEEAREVCKDRIFDAPHPLPTPWIYLEPILSNDEGELGSKFRKVDQGFRQVTRILEADPRLIALLQSARLQPMLDAISDQLNACQSALNQYIDEKRNIFPRLYFLSDDDLLELLGQARAGAEGRETVMQSHLKKLFPGITGVRLGPGGLSITSLCQLGETFQLDHPVDIDCAVEVWLKNLESEMRSSLKNLTLKCIVTNSLQEQDPFSLPTQILCLTQNIRFTEQAEKAIRSKELHKLKMSVEKENTYYVAAEVEDENEKLKRQALVLQCAYYISLVQMLIEKNVVSTNDWHWQKQLRFYLLSTKEVVAKMGLAQIEYSYEYLGVNTGQFVRTELADECFLILTQSLHLGMVGNPFGPAGTGKTESVKALGALVGRLVLVFNCDEAMDAACMGRLLSGLALSGVWGCFDEFNRLTADTLASVSHQFASLMAATLEREPGAEPTALLNGKHVRVSRWCGVAVTLNPSGRGYGGRRALPPALQRLLRPLAMTEPGARPLAERLFAALGASEPHALASDLTAVFTLASALLSSQKHYDWGLRALKAVVGGFGAAPRDTSISERALLRRLLVLNNVSKLTHVDLHIFENILSMIFADVPKEERSTDPLVTALETTLENLGLIHNKQQIQKCLELHEQLRQRMGVVIVGPPGSGKTTIRRLLKTALAQQGRHIAEYVIYPKAMSRNWLMGNIDHDTRQWSDGVISTTALEVSNQPNDVWSWVVCDGDVDPEWIEALNSVLDDNRLLTLPSGWRIQFGQNVNFIFETHSLEHASPATISRMGIILFSEENSCTQEVLDKWLRKVVFDNETVKMALPILNQVIKKCINWLAAHKADLIVKRYTISVVQQILMQFEYIAQSRETFVTSEEYVYLAVQRTVLCILKDSAIENFCEEVLECPGGHREGVMDVGDAGGDSGGGGAVVWSARLRGARPAVRALAAAAPLLLLAPPATAKLNFLEYFLKESDETVITIDCTPILEPPAIIAELKRHNVVRSGGRGGAGAEAEAGALRGRCVLLVRSLHRARTDAWGSRPVHAFLLQVVKESGFWAVEEGGAQWYWAPLRVVATASPPAPLAPRLAHALTLHTLPEPDDDELLELCRNFLFENLPKNIADSDISHLSRILLDFYKEITETFYSRPHYKWNASHLKRTCENVKLYAPATVEQIVMGIQAETNMIFKNRLVTEEEMTMFDVISRKYLKSYNTEDVYFKPKLRNDGIYLEVTDYKNWHQYTQKLLNQCRSENENDVYGVTDIEVCSELSILCPAIIRASGGAVTCVSGAGAGRRAAAALVSAALPATLFLMHNPHHFAAQFKQALVCAGEGRRAVAVVCEAVASDAAGTLEAVLRARSPHALPNHVAPPPAPNLAFLDLKQNLTIVICLDKDQADLEDLMEKYPFLYNDNDVMWLNSWSDETLRKMPSLIIQRLMKENTTELTKEDLETIPFEGFVNIFKSLEKEWLRAPCRYVNFIKSYYNIMNKKKSTLLQRQNMLSAGVEALRCARNEVEKLQAEAAEQGKILSDKQAQANQALDQIGATVRANTDKREEMHTLKKNIEIENEKLQKRKKEIEEELASVEPVIAAARAAVGDIRPESLSEIRSLRAPPDVVRDVLEGVLRLMGIADTSWHSMKNFLSKRGVKEDIRWLDASQISAEAAQSVRRLLDKRGASFEPGAARRASAACAPLAAWVTANLAYADALARTRPLQDHQRALARNLERAEAEMASLSSGLETVEERVSALKEELGRHTRDAAALEMRLAASADTIRAASHLLQQLTHEDRTWADDLENISKEILQLNYRCLLAAAYIVYLPDLIEPQARKYINKWSAMLHFEEDSFSVINFLSTPEKQLKWESDGLSIDQTALKNAVIIDQALESEKCGLTPFIIDPDGDAVAWLKNALANTQCEFVSQHSEKLNTALQYAIKLGRVVVVTEAEAEGAWVAAARGGARLAAMSRDAAAARRLPPHTAARLATVHFTAHLDALTDQLVHHVMQTLNPEVNEQAKKIKINKASLLKQQHELQEEVLRELSSKSDILHDAQLLASLQCTRTTSATIQDALRAARDVEEASGASRARFVESARAAATLALAVRALNARRPRLALSARTLLDAYLAAVRSQPDPKNVNTDEVVKNFTRRMIERILLSLHKKDKYIVVLYLLKQVYGNFIPDKLWELFVTTLDFVNDQDVINEIKSKYQWLNEDCVKKMALLKVKDEDLFNRLSLDDTVLWTEFMSSGDLHLLSKLKLSAFETVATVASLRPDSLYRTIVTFVDNILGGGSMSGGGAVSAAARWSGPRRPALLLAAHASDALAAHAPSGLTQVGVEEGPAAWQAALEASRGGGAWLAIVVGASPFPRLLQHFLEDLAERPVEEFHEDFRLWIVSEDRDIPTMISNACVNVVLEAPEGVKRNVTSTLSAWCAGGLGGVGPNASAGAPRGGRLGDATLVRYLACLALFHAIVQERRSYIPQGWSRWYGWEWSEACAAGAAARTLGVGPGGGGGGGARALCGALYAARVCSARDRLVLGALARAWLADAALAHAWRPPALHPLRAPLPYSTDLQMYASAFEALPDIDSPELLGLPANCRVAWERNAADEIINGLKEIDSVSDKKGDERSTSLKPLLALWKKLMSGSPLLKGEYGGAGAGRGWWAGVMACEALEAAACARAVHASLALLARTQQVPGLDKAQEQWQARWAGPPAADAYLRELAARAHFAARPPPQHASPDYMPHEVDVRHLLRAERVAWAVRARAAAAARRSPTALVLHATACGGEGDVVANGDDVVVHGLRVCGGEWAAGGVRPASSRASPHAPAPPLRLRCLPQESAESGVEVAVYGSERRERVLFEVRVALAPDFPPDATLLNGLALFVAPLD